MTQPLSESLQFEMLRADMRILRNEMREFREAYRIDAPNIVVTIGFLDRCLSEMLVLTADPATSTADLQTIKHHADDLEGVAAKIKSLLASRGAAENR